MSDLTEWISAASSVIAATGIIFVAFQSYLAKLTLEQGKSSLEQVTKSLELARKSLSFDHERSRRENAARLILEWSRNIKLETSFARKLVEKLSREETIKLYDQVPFSIDEEHKNLVAGCLSGSKENEIVIENRKIKLTEKQSSQIDWLITSYLNLLESVLVHWQHGIADEEILKKEYKYLVNPDAEIYILHRYRTAKEGVDHFPAIRDFANLLKKEHEIQNGQRDNIV